MNTKLFASLKKLIALFAILALLPSTAALANAGRPPAPVAPVEQMPAGENGNPIGRNFSKSAATLLAGGDLYQAAADRLTALQNNDGGWDWPLDDGNPASTSPSNTVGPIAQGLAMAYLHTGDPAHLAALQEAGAFLLAKTNTFSPSDGYLAATLDMALGGTTYTQHVLTYYYGPLHNGTYDRNGAGTLYDIAGYVNYIRTSRANQGIPNLAAWDLGLGLVGSIMAGADPADINIWIAGVEAEIDELDGSKDYDVIGLAGAVYSLAFAGVDYDPTAGEHAAAANLADLGAILASYQIPASGGFTWNKDHVASGEEVIQETAYSILALDELGRPTYQNNISDAADYIKSVQLGTGGWESYPGDGENNEITGEALWAIQIAYPTPEVWVCPGASCGPSIPAYASFSNLTDAIDAVQMNGLVTVQQGTYSEGQIVISKSLGIAGDHANPTKPVVQPNANFTGNNAGQAWWLVEPGVTFSLHDVVLDGTGFNVWQGIRSHGNTLIGRVDFRNILDSSNPYYGVAVAGLGGVVSGGYGADSHGGAGGPAGTLFVEDCTFTNIGRIGVLVKGDQSQAGIARNTYTGKGAGDWLDYAFEVGSGGVAVIGGANPSDANTISDNTGVASTDGSTSAGILVTTYYGPGTNATIANNSIRNSTTGVMVGYDAGDTSTVVVHQNRFSGNTRAVESTQPHVNAVRNWWGTAVPDWAVTISGDVAYDPWYIDEALTTLSNAPRPAVYVDDDYTGSSAGGHVFGLDAFATIQAGITAVDASGTVNVAAGTYNEDVNINKPLSLAGAGAGSTTIRGVVGGDGATVRIAASSVTVTGFTITRNGNNLTDWNDPGLNFAGIAIQGASFTGLNVHDNILTGNRTGIDINNSSGHTISNNLITDNRTGMILRNQTDNLTVTGNEITNNWTLGVVFLDASSGTNSPVQTALNSTFNDNNISGNWYGQVADRQTGGSLPMPGTTNLKDFSPNWWGTATPVVSTADSTEPGYASLIPVAYGGTAVPPAAQPDILGPASANITYDPRYVDAAMTVLSNGSRPTVYVDDNYTGSSAGGHIFGYDAFATIQAGIAAVDAGGTVNVAAGVYAENVVIDKTLTLAGAGATSTIIQPAISDPNCGGAGAPSSMCPGASHVILVQADNVVIHDLTVDGDNPLLTSAYNIGGANIDARNGIITNHPVGTYNGLEVYNTTIRNIYLRGLYASSGGTFNFHNNTVVNVKGEDASIAIFNFAGSGTIANNAVSDANDAISANWSMGTQFLNNTVTDSASGVHTDNAGSGSTVVDLIQGNTITNCKPDGYGIWVFVPYLGPTVNNNTVTNCNIGLAAWGQAQPATTQFTNNRVTGPSLAAGSVGAYIATDQIGWGYNDVSVNFSGNVITGFETGVFLTADAQAGTPGWVSKTVTATFHLNQIYGNTIPAQKGTTGVYVADLESNWWGLKAGPSGVTSLDYTPWCANTVCSVLIPAGAGIHDDVLASWDYSGSWSSYTGTGPYNDTNHYTGTTGNEARFIFDGIRFAFTYVKASTRGLIDVYVDGSKIAQINAKGSTTVWQQTWTSPTFAAGIHTVRLVHAGGGTYIDVDAIQIFGAPAPVGAGIHDDTHTSWMFSDGWLTYSGAGPYNNTSHYVNTVGSDAQITFNGNRFIFTYVKASNRGLIDVYVDGTRIDQINARGTSTTWQQTWTSPVFPAGQHTVRFVHAGGGTYIDVDAIEILVPSDSTAPAALGDLNGTTGVAPGTVNLEWTATGDDGSTGTATSYLVRYSTSAIGDETAWNAATPVTSGIPIPAASGSTESMTVSGLIPDETYFFAVRAMDEDGNLGGLSNSASATAQSAGPIGAGSYDDSDTNWLYIGTWATYNGGGPANNTLHYSGVAGSEAQITFNGVKFALTYVKSPDRGSIDVYVDGTKIAQINAHSAGTTWQATWTSPYFAAGVHTLRLVHAGGGTYIDVDAIQIFDAPAPVSAGTYDDNNANWLFRTGWSTYSGAGPYSNTLHFTNVVGAETEIRFTGTQFKLTYTKSADRGLIDIYIDGSFVTSIDAHSATTAWKQTWTSSSLSAGTHTVRFVHGGGGTYIDIDAITIYP